MIVVTLNDHFREEKQYALDMLFGQFLGLNYKIIIDVTVVEITVRLNNDSTIVFEDHFFSKFNEKDGYKNIQNFPVSIDKNIIQKFNLPFLSLYGPAEMYFNEKEIRISGDLVAATFFMLTRWEESVAEDRDIYNRFPAEAAIAVKFDFIDRPIVNEYVEIIWSCLELLDIDQARLNRSFNTLLTHDVDLPRMWWDAKGFIRSIVGSILKRKSVKEAVILVKKYLNRKDPFNVFDWMLDLSDETGHISHFFFMSGGTSSKDNYYSIDHPFISRLIKNIKRRGHRIGFHPSFNAYNDIIQFSKEKEALERIVQKPMVTGRHHFLRFENPTTWQIWEDCNMEWDSTMSYHDNVGFRCGVCYPFQVFNINTRKQLKLLERPLIVMESSLAMYQDKGPEVMKNQIFSLIDIVKSYEGEFVFLWHNSAFNTIRWKPYEYIYKATLEYCASLRLPKK